MKITETKTQYHDYLFTFDFNWHIVNELKAMQKDFDWRELTYCDKDGVKGWAFSSPAIGALLMEKFKPSCTIKFETGVGVGDVLAPQGYIDASKDLNALQLSNLTPIQCVRTEFLFDFQKRTLDFIEKVGGKALLALDMGTGKTIVAIGYALWKEYQRVLVICPASVKENWKREIKTFGKVDANILTSEEYGGWDIVNYDQLRNYENYIKKQDYDLVVFDESHLIKNPKAIRTKLALQIAKKGKDFLFLTGTPVMNKPLEIFTTFNLISPIKYWDFVMRYCNPKKTTWGWDFSGASHLDELKERMYFMIRLTKEQILPELPEKTVSIIDTEMKDWAEYNQVRKDYRSWLLENEKNLDALYAEALTKVNYLKQVTVKNKNIEEIVDNFLENGAKILVFSQYTEVIDRLYTYYQDKAVRLTGATPAEDRQGLVDEFQNNEKTRLFLSTLKAGGVGLTLTKADTVVFTDLDYVPANHLQAEDRALRIGQKNAVGVYYLITPDTLEEDIWKLLRRKEKVVEKIMSGDDNVRKVHLKSLFKKI